MFHNSLSSTAAVSVTLQSSDTVLRKKAEAQIKQALGSRVVTNRDLMHVISHYAVALNYYQLITARSAEDHEALVKIELHMAACYFQSTGNQVLNESFIYSHLHNAICLCRAAPAILNRELAIDVYLQKAVDNMAEERGWLPPRAIQSSVINVTNPSSEDESYFRCSLM
jgi:hypothetical protein